MGTKILIIDDEKELLFGLSELLTQEKYEVITASTGADGISIATQTNPELILCDINMPHPNGFEVQQQLSQLTKAKAIPFVFLTARTNERDITLGLLNGADDYIIKPFDPDELVTRIKNILGRTDLPRTRAETKPFKEPEIAINPLGDQFDLFRDIVFGINDGKNLSNVINLILNKIVSLEHVVSAHIWLPRQQNSDVQYYGGAGEYPIFDVCRHIRWILKLVKNHQTEIVDLQQYPLDGGEDPGIARLENFAWYIGIPIKSNLSAAVLELFFEPIPRIPIETIEIVNLLAGYIILAIEKEQLLQHVGCVETDLQFYYDQTILGWLTTLNLRSHETMEHSLRVSEFTVELAKLFDIEGEELKQIRRGALLHDIGKIGIPESILLKPGRLADEEWQLVKHHPVYARELLSDIPFLEPALAIPCSHHEKWDGTGYPLGLKGECIPLPARIFAIVDVWDALLSDRPYHKGIPEDEVVQYIQSQSGKHFDPVVVEKFLYLIQSNKNRYGKTEENFDY